jgi:hypothetical protein
MDEFAAALALNSKAHLYLRQTRASLELAPSEERDHLLLPLSPADLEDLERHATDGDRRMSLDWYAAASPSGIAQEEEDKDGLPDVSQLELGGDEAVVRGRKGGKSNKPLFFDIAYNYAVEFDLSSIQVAAGLAEQEVKEGEGVTGMQGVVEEKKQKVEEEQGEPAKPARRGIWGLFGS